LSHLLGMPVQASFRLHVPYASLSRVQVHHSDDGDFAVLTAFNWRGGR
jgi:hypothetical protein